MAEPKDLRMGADSPSPSMHEEEARVAILEATIERYLPEFVATIKNAAEAAEDSAVVLHQDAFCAGYDDDEYMLLGMAIKFAGMHGVALNIIGKNLGTLK
jgi:hypothetical protein